jgi:hypothetical protein
MQYLTNTGLSPPMVQLSSTVLIQYYTIVPGPTTPYPLTSMVWAPSLSLATTHEIISYFLLLWVLRCFSSPRSPPLRDIPSPTGWVAPFGHLRIYARLQLPTAFRSLPRPSSPPKA